MGAEIKFERDWERKLRDAVKPQMQQIVSDFQIMTDHIGRQCAGRPVEEVKGVLAREWAKVGDPLTDPELTQYATILSEGGRIEFQLGY